MRMSRRLLRVRPVEVMILEAVAQRLSHLQPSSAASSGGTPASGVKTPSLVRQPSKRSDSFETPASKESPAGEGGDDSASRAATERTLPKDATVPQRVSHWVGKLAELQKIINGESKGKVYIHQASLCLNKVKSEPERVNLQQHMDMAAAAQTLSPGACASASKAELLAAMRALSEHELTWPVSLQQCLWSKDLEAATQALIVDMGAQNLQHWCKLVLPWSGSEVSGAEGAMPASDEKETLGQYTLASLDLLPHVKVSMCTDSFVKSVVLSLIRKGEVAMIKVKQFSSLMMQEPLGSLRTLVLEGPVVVAAKMCCCHSHSLDVFLWRLC